MNKSESDLKNVNFLVPEIKELWVEKIKDKLLIIQSEEKTANYLKFWDKYFLIYSIQLFINVKDSLRLWSKQNEIDQCLCAQL